MGIGTMALIAGNAAADIVHADDTIIQFSLCVGNDCINGESFGFDTVRMKENNLRLHFDDTSASASFPANDWRIVANDSANGGANYLAFEDSTAGRQVFRVDAGAPASSLHVDSGGDVGIGTGTPVVELHVADGDSPTLRLEQNGSSGFTPQTWDLAGNETNFFVRDVTNGSQLPFRIQPGADTNSLYVADDNNIGLGTANPVASLHVSRNDNTANFLVYDTAAATSAPRDLFSGFKRGGPSIGLWDISVDNYWRTTGGTTYEISEGSGLGGAFTSLFSLTTGGNLTIPGTLTTGGSTCGTGCDKVFEADYALPSIEEHAAAMFENKYLPNVGPTIENEPINVSDKLGRMLNELEKAHIYIADLNEQNKMLKERLEKIELELQ